ncbi:hypothetical protein YC2023_008938 [Brassica napus]
MMGPVTLVNNVVEKLSIIMHISRRNTTRGGRARTISSLTPLATTSKVSPFTMATGTLTGVSKYGTTR